MLVVNVLWAGLWIASQALAQDSCEGQSFGSRAVDPEDSHNYILCLGFLGQIKSSCNDGYLFEPQSQGCVPENQAIHKLEMKKQKKQEVKQTINVDKPVIFNIFGNLNIFGRFWGNSQEPITSRPPTLTKFSLETSPEKILAGSVDISSLFHKDFSALVDASSSGLSTEVPSDSSSESPPSTEPALDSSTPESENPPTTEGQQEGINSSSESPLSTEASTEAARESTSTESAIESSTQESEPSSENPLTTEASLEDIVSSSEDPLSTSPAEDSSSTESPSDSSTPESDSSSENPLTTEASLEDSSSSSDDPLSTSPAEDSSTTESPSESSTQESDSSSENPLTTEASLEDISSSSEDPLSTSPAEDLSSTESPSESSSSENPLTTEASLEDSSSSSEDPLSTSPAEDLSSTESPSESSTPENDSSSENPLTTEASLDDISSSSEDPLSTSPAEDSSSTEPPLESSTQESISSSENPLTTDASWDIGSTEPESSTEAGSEDQSSTEPSPESSTESTIEPPPETSTEAESSSSTEPSQSTEIQSSTESSPEAISTESSPPSTTEKNESSSENPLTTESTSKSTTEGNAVSSANPPTDTPCITQNPGSENDGSENGGPGRETSTIESTSQGTTVGSKHPTTTVCATDAPQRSSSSEPSRKLPNELVKINEERTVCSNLPDGAFLRVPNSCRKYYICVNGKPISLQCAINLKFDIEKKVCNFPHLVNCSYNGVPEFPVSTEAPASAPATYSTDATFTPTQKEISGNGPKKHFDYSICSDLPNGVFLRNPRSCNKYYICLNGKAVSGKCPTHLNFDIRRKVCNFPYLVDCSNLEAPETTTPLRDLKDSSVPDCKSERNGAYLRDPKSCSKFYVCANGRALRRECPGDLYFDFKFRFCNYPNLVQCSVDKTPGDNPKPLIGGVLPNCGASEEGKAFGDITHHNIYYVCTKGFAILHYCRTGQWFDHHSHKCIGQPLVKVN